MRFHPASGAGIGSEDCPAWTSEAGQRLNPRRSLNVQALALLFGSVTAQLVVASLYILTARSMRPDEYGLVITAISLGLAGAGFADLGANAYWVRELASRRITQDDLDARISTRFLIILFVATFGVVAAVLIDPVFVVTGVLLLTASTVQTVLVPLRAAQRSDSVGWLVMFGRLLALVIFLGQTAVGVTPGLVLWTSLAFGDVALAVCAFAVTPAPDRLKPRLRPIKNPWSGTKWYAVTAMSTSAQQLDLPILAAISGSAAAGIYGGVNRWTQPMLVAIGAFTFAAAPFVAAERRLVALRGQMLRASWILMVVIVLSLSVFAMAPWIVVLLLGVDFRGSAPVLQLLALAMLLNAVTQPLMMVLQSRQLDHIAAAIVVGAIAAQLVAVVVLAPALGALGAGIGVLVAQVVALLGAVGYIAVVVRRRNGLTN